MNKRLRKIKCTAFKPSGKYYAKGEGVLPEDWFLHSGNCREYVTYYNGGTIPGLSSDGKWAIIVVEFLEDFNHAVPFIIPEGV